MDSLFCPRCYCKMQSRLLFDVIVIYIAQDRAKQGIAMSSHLIFGTTARLAAPERQVHSVIRLRFGQDGEAMPVLTVIPMRERDRDSGEFYMGR